MTLSDLMSDNRLYGAAPGIASEFANYCSPFYFEYGLKPTTYVLFTIDLLLPI